MKALVTGQTGLNKSDYLIEIQKMASQQGKKVEVFQVGPEMIECYQGRISEKTILNLPKTLLDLLRRFAWKNILAKANSPIGEPIIVVNSHAVFRWHHGMFPAIDLDLVLQLNPDIVITLIDDIDRVKKNLQVRETDIFELWELLAWREEEIWVTKLLTNNLKKITGKETKYFVLPCAQGPELLYRILTEMNTPKIYLSFPKTGLPQEKEKEVEDFKKKVTELFITFDPLSLQERAIVSMAESLSKEIDAELKKRFKTDTDFHETPLQELWRWSRDSFSALSLTEIKVDNFFLQGRQIISILEAVDSQIISRDYLLIDQSDIVLMYIRTDENGTPQISAGSQSEMIYAYSQGKPVYVVCPSGQKGLSPWVTQFSRVFVTLESALDFLSQES